MGKNCILYYHFCIFTLFLHRWICYNYSNNTGADREERI